MELKDIPDDVDDADDTVHDDEVDPVEYELINVVVLPRMMLLLLPLILFDNMAMDCSSTIDATGRISQLHALFEIDTYNISRF